jgi:KaiC/GvpD/RAD55 family RecA-like ATPase
VPLRPVPSPESGPSLRAWQRRALVEYLRRRGEDFLTVATPGAGKTAFALRVAHELAPRFPDAHLYVDLRGTHEQPAEPAEVLGRLLSALGQPQRLIPGGLEARTARFRAA